MELMRVYVTQLDAKWWRAVVSRVAYGADDAFTWEDLGQAECIDRERAVRDAVGYYRKERAIAR